MSTPTFKFVVEYEVEDSSLAQARFTNEKHAKTFYKRQKSEGLRSLKMFELDADGNKGKEIKFR